MREKITRLKKTLKRRADQRSQRREKRDDFSMLTIALVGYTNSGKSTLFNTLTGAGIPAKDQLFSTLDPTVRKVTLKNNQTVLLSDTVGFLHDLPHHLIESFKATLEEVVEADILFHVIYATDCLMEKRVESVENVLRELGVEQKPSIHVLNKIDRVEDDREKDLLSYKLDKPVLISALKKENIFELTERIMEYVRKDMVKIELTLPHEYYSFVKLIREKGDLEKEKYEDDGIYIRAMIPSKVKNVILNKLSSKSHG